jgi:hypothetical protein
MPRGSDGLAAGSICLAILSPTKPPAQCLSRTHRNRARLWFAFGIVPVGHQGGPAARRSTSPQLDGGLRTRPDTETDPHA